MKYPYIGKGTESGSLALIYGKDSAIVMDSKTWAAKDSEDTEVDESYFKNITAEYLANTYGEVKSKEHAEFIVKLAKVNNFRLCNPEKTDKKWFCFDDNELYFFDDVEDASDLDEKQVTIPLPPECESADEWPVIGDRVQTSIGEGEIKLMPDGRGLYIACVDGDYYAFSIEQLSKPKTPEQELRDDLMEFIDGKNQSWIKNGRGHIDSTTVFEFISDALINEYNITKKGEGDESR